MCASTGEREGPDADGRQRTYCPHSAAQLHVVWQLGPCARFAQKPHAGGPKQNGSDLQPLPLQSFPASTPEAPPPPPEPVTSAAPPCPPPPVGAPPWPPDAAPPTPPEPDTPPWPPVALEPAAPPVAVAPP